MSRNYENQLRINLEWRERNREKLRAQGRARYHRDKQDPEKAERMRVQKRAYYHRHKARVKAKAYNTTEEVINALPKQCQICGGKKRMCVDHDHETGEVRGALCHYCNSALGHFRDSPELIQRALDYLTQPV